MAEGQSQSTAAATKEAGDGPAQSAAAGNGKVSKADTSSTTGKGARTTPAVKDSSKDKTAQATPPKQQKTTWAELVSKDPEQQSETGPPPNTSWADLSDSPPPGLRTDGFGFPREPANPSNRADPTNVFIKNLPLDLSEEVLALLFSPFGEVVSTRLMRDAQTSASLGFGFVRMRTEESANKAIEHFNGRDVAGIRLIAKHADKHRTTARMAPPPTTEDDPTNLYVRGLPLDMQDKEFRDIFSCSGKVVDHTILLDKEGRSRGMGLIRFSTTEEARKAIAAMNLLKLSADLPPLQVKFADRKNRTVPNMVHHPIPYHPPVQAPYMPQHHPQSFVPSSNYSYAPPSQPQPVPPAAPPSWKGGGRYKPYASVVPAPVPVPAPHPVPQNDYGTNLFIFHLPYDVDEDGLYNLFSPFGPIQSVKIVTDTQGASRGFGFVKFYEADCAATALSTMNGFQVGKKFLKVTMKN